MPSARRCVGERQAFADSNRRQGQAIERFSIQKLACWAKAHLRVDVLGLRVLRMHRQLDDLTGRVTRFDLLNEQFERFPAIALALMTSIDEKMEHPVEVSLLFAGLIGQRDEPHHLVFPVESVRYPLEAKRMHVGFRQRDGGNGGIVRDKALLFSSTTSR